MPSNSKRKVVRFAYKLNTFHSPPPPPALSFGSSAQSSNAPITPPNVQQGLPGPTPYASTYFPTKPREYAPIGPHRYLESNGIAYNVMDHPSSALRHRERVSHRALGEPATHPPVFFMSLKSAHLPWTIRVYASNNSFVTVGDVLEAVYRSLRSNITREEFDSLPTTHDQLRATRSYEQRYRRLRDPKSYDSEKRGGMKRVDFLMGHTQFLGIANNGTRPEEWLLFTT